MLFCVSGHISQPEPQASTSADADLGDVPHEVQMCSDPPEALHVELLQLAGHLRGAHSELCSRMYAMMTNLTLCYSARATSHRRACYRVLSKAPNKRRCVHKRVSACTQEYLMLERPLPGGSSPLDRLRRHHLYCRSNRGPAQPVRRVQHGLAADANQPQQPRADQAY